MNNNILSGLAQGLRGVGAVMNPNVYQAQRHEEQAALEREQRNKELMLGIVIRGIESGAIDPEKGKAVLSKLDPAAGGLPIGPSFDVREKLRLQQEESSLKSGRLADQDKFFQVPERAAPISLSPVGQGTGFNRQQADSGFVDLASASGVNNLRRPDSVEGGLNFGGIEGLGMPGLEMDRRPDANSTAPAYNPRQDPAAWLRYADSRDLANDVEEADRARKIAKDLEDKTNPKHQVVGNRIVTISPSVVDGSVAGYSATSDEIPGLAPDVKSQVVDLGDRLAIVDTTKIGTEYKKGLSPKDSLKGVDALTQKDVVEIESKLRDDFWQQAGKEFTAIRDFYDRVQASVDNPSPAGDLSLIFNYMKMLDPTSVVREGEFATAASAGSVPDRVWALYNKVLSGERLSDPIRNDFVVRTEKLFERAQKNYSDTVDRYKGISERSGADWRNVLPKISTSGLPVSGAGATGWSIERVK